ncbi:AzlC family ABC transporter permease [Aquibaculum arenosum]|uniref:AzlC family ABC transporter permease n=1 Tax=Aquibaculum arenosum TaxID=3032591 RepID=A0ABT5YMH1_9PROT|nr:AzlC family ABC transporter permease [Fodinicurvata sp. CAU 1616]MDF2096059.1 AzlC family ABC transporter permease [Fodinicurvata sp. CAU 1616]
MSSVGRARRAGDLPSEVIFTLVGFRHGFLAALPLGMGAATFGALFGFLADQRGLSALESLLMSGLVFAGASQLLALELWADPPSIILLSLGAAFVNLRFMMMAAALRPWLAPLPPATAYGSLLLLVDMNFALSLGEIRRGKRDAAYFVGAGFLLWLIWIASTGFGFAFGHLLEDPEAWGLDFLVAACFLAMLVPLFERHRSIAPWAMAAGASLLAWHFLPGASYLLVGALAGATTGALLDGRR